MPSLYKPTNGIYYSSFKEDGKWKCRSTGQRQKPAALKELVSFQPRQVSKPKVTFQTFTKDFLFCFGARELRAAVAMCTTERVK